MQTTKNMTDKIPLNRIEQVLKENDKSVYWLCNNLEYTYPTVTKWVKNKSQPNLEQLNEIAKVLNTGIENLIVKR